MASESAVIVTAKVGGATVLKKQSSDLRLVLDEPCTWSIVLDNSGGDYDPDEAIANPRTYSAVLSLTYDDGADPWTSPDLILEDYDYDTGSVTIGGRCRLSQLDRDDQFVDSGDGTATFEDTTVAAVINAILAAVSLTQTGAPTRAVKKFHAVGNLLDLVRDLLYPTHRMRMGAGSQVVIQAIDAEPAGPSYTDVDHVEILTFARTSEIYNKATVERVSSVAGWQVLAEAEVSGGDTLADVQTIELDTPSRSFIIAQRYGKRGVIDSVVLRDSGGASVGATPYPQIAYSGNTSVSSIDFQYSLNVGAADYGPFTPEYYWRVEGYPDSVSAPETEGYSATATAGSGDRPYPEPFTSLAIETEADAQAAADALVVLGTRLGNMLNFNTRLNPTKIPWPNMALDLTDGVSGLTGTEWICETVTITEDESGETGNILIEATRSEAS